MKQYQKPVWFLIFSVLLIVSAVLSLEMRTDIEDFFFPGDELESAFLVSQLNSDQLQQRTIIGVDHVGIDQAQVRAFMQSFEQSLAAIPGVARVWSDFFEAQDLQQLLYVYSAYQIQLLSLNPEQEIATLLTDERLQASAQRVVSMLSGPDPGQVKSLIENDPMLLSIDWLKRIQSQYQTSQALPGFSALFLDSDKASAVDPAFIQQQIQAVFESLNAGADNAFSLNVTGIPVFAISIRQSISHDIEYVSVLSSLLILFLFIVVFRSLRALLLTALMLLTAVSGAALSTQMVFGYIHGLTLALGATLIGICIDYFIHAMIHCDKQTEQENTWQVRKIWPSLIMGGGTTLLGYIALGASGFPGLQQVAVFSGSGIVIALIMSRWIVPGIMSLKGFKLKPPAQFVLLLNALNNKVVRLLLPSVALLFFALGLNGINWRDDLELLSPDLSRINAQDKAVRKQLSTIEPGRFIVIRAPNLELALQKSEALQSVLDDLKQEGTLAQYYSVYPWIVSGAVQSRNLNTWNSLLESGLLQDWESAVSEAGLVPDPFRLQPLDTQKMLGLDDLQSTGAGELLARQIVSTDTDTMVFTWLGKHDVDKLKQALAGIDGVEYFSQKDSVNLLSKTYRERASWMLLWGLAGILLLLTWSFRSGIKAILVLSPAMLSIAFVLGIWGIWGKPMGMLHLVGLLLAAAICVDYSIFFFKNVREDRALTFQAITMSALTSTVSFACLGVADNPALQALAWTVAPGILAGFLLCPAILGRKLIPANKVGRP